MHIFLCKLIFSGKILSGSMFCISENKMMQHVVCYENNKVYKNDTKFTKERKDTKKGTENTEKQKQVLKRNR